MLDASEHQFRRGQPAGELTRFAGDAIAVDRPENRADAWAAESPSRNSGGGSITTASGPRSGQRQNSSIVVQKSAKPNRRRVWRHGSETADVITGASKRIENGFARPP